ncbi:putative serine/threonine-protein kinase pknB [Apostichopus japonicus]|uniref:Putative serine/threonine-protein kinase pknB n=1 Tax=Stichopus japonicus TaxID=307972 RepID=A0A2G8JLD8_STIJA|nr:putative serine/threonine-protein kinase pknB [Apostichopus japonicus]
MMEPINMMDYINMMGHINKMGDEHNLSILVKSIENLHRVLEILINGIFGLFYIISELEANRYFPALTLDGMRFYATEHVLQSEINSLAALNGLDCVPQLYGVSKTEAGVQFLVKEVIGDPSKLRCTTLETAISAKEIYNRRVLHCDLKVDNVMLMPGFVRDDDPKITLIDFGRAISLNQPPVFENLGTLEQQEILEHCGQMAPEVVKGETPYGLSSEVYSLGLKFREMGCRFDGFLTQLGRECIKSKLSLRPDFDE